ncbi:SDR family NAD(P)-dependent oxidoreductase [Photobacterium sp. OFAV2-7]|uniref:SDR family NAD(P)-dependent oxidoreductase n=1 Tax=Photobacterium sp. OFAV2-7 TaxID=2917748 RepID=UPI001EF4646F|nr:SDR family NAD(P)-dependent oxidoreductase [Photobacterium sp. OFAV2-7]MCG7585836.1 SDR family NAD(P)-dependent oxidoreductase [Photobacterium sp. OFAV2-7]
MQKIILVTGSTDGIGLETAKKLVELGNHVLLHGRNPGKLKDAEDKLKAFPGSGKIDSYVCDLSSLADVSAFAKTIARHHPNLDVVINNAGVYSTANTITQDGLDVRFAVNTIAPYLLTQQLAPLLGPSGRVINLSSAAQAPVNTEALIGKAQLSDGEAYAQSKLALTMWTRSMAQSLNGDGPVIVAVNPASMLGSKMVKDAFGVAGGDIKIGADILCRAALSDEFATASGLYFDNDIGRFSSPHPDALNDQKSQDVVSAIESVLDRVIP